MKPVEAKLVMGFSLGFNTLQAPAATHWIGGRVVPRDDLEAMAKRRIPAPQSSNK